MGNTNFSSFLFGNPQPMQSSPSPHSAEAAAAGSPVEVPNWCLNTADYARESQGIIWDANMCHSSMRQDVDAIVKNADNYIKYLGSSPDTPVENQSKFDRKVVLTDFDNSSNMPGPSGSEGDDPRWILELTKLVTEELKKQGRNVSADTKEAIKNRSKLSRRPFLDYKGRGSPETGDINVVFGFTGRA